MFTLSGKHDTRLSGKHDTPLSGKHDTSNKEESSKGGERLKKSVSRGSKTKKEDSPPSADATELCEYLLSRIKKKKPDFIQKSKGRWLKDAEEMLHKDKRSLSKAKEIIDWLANSRKGFAFIQSPASLKDQFDKEEMRMEADISDTRIKNNRTFALSMKERYPQQYKHLQFDQENIGNLSASKSITCDQPHESFVQALYKLFGVRNV